MSLRLVWSAPDPVYVSGCCRAGYRPGSIQPRDDGSRWYVCESCDEPCWLVPVGDPS